MSGRVAPLAFTMGCALLLVAAIAAAPAARLGPTGVAWAQAPPGGVLTLRGGFTSLPDAGTLVLAGMDRPASPTEVEAVGSFLGGGGRLLVAQPDPASASLLAALGARLQLGPGTLFDPDQDPEGRFIATGTGRFVAGSLHLEQATIVSGGEALVLSSPFAWQDVAADGEPGLDDPRGTWPLGAWQGFGQGEIVALGSSAILAEPGAQALRDWATAAGPLIVDASHEAGADPLGLAALLAGASPATVAAAMAAPLLAALGVAWGLRLARTGPRRARRPLDLETLEMVAELPTGDVRRG